MLVMLTAIGAPVEPRSCGAVLVLHDTSPKGLRTLRELCPRGVICEVMLHRFKPLEVPRRTRSRQLVARIVRGERTARVLRARVIRILGLRLSQLQWRIQVTSGAVKSPLEPTSRAIRMSRVKPRRHGPFAKLRDMTGLACGS